MSTHASIHPDPLTNPATQPPKPTPRDRGPRGLKGGDRPHLQPLPRPPFVRGGLLGGLLVAGAVRYYIILYNIHTIYSI